MADESSAVRKLFQILISLGIRRCRQSGILCRLTTSLKCFRESQPPSVRISISDTGIGSSLEEFRTLDFGSSSPPSDKWDGLLSITTTSINEKYIHHYQLNLRETLSSRMMLKRLRSTSKHVGTFSGTEVCLSTEEGNIDEFVAWIVHFVQKMHVLKPQDILVDLSVEHIDNCGSRHEHVIPTTENPFPAPFPVTTTKCMCSGLGEYILKHRGSIDISCSARMEDMKVGMGHASNTGAVRNAEQVFDVAIVIVPVTIVPCCLKASSQKTEIHKYTPDLSQTIASLIASSNDQEFHGECASLLGLQARDASTEMLALRIQEKLTEIVGMNDMKHKAERDLAPNLFE